MPASTAPAASRRLLALLTLLQTPREWPAPALAERLGVSERTIRRDVERLRDLDYAIESTRGPIGGYRLTAGADLPPLLFDDGQAVAIALALRTAASRGAQLEDDAARALVTVERMLPSRLAHRVEALRAVAAAASEVSVDPAVLVRIGEAVRARRELRFGYLPAGRGDEAPGPPLRTQPHHVLLHGGRWYVIGWTTEREAWRTYRVDRMVLRSHDGAEFTPRVVPGGDPAAFLAARFKGSEGGVDAWPVRGTATIHAPVGAVAPYIDDGALEQVALDRQRVTLGAWSWVALAALFARFDAPLSDVEPAELRDGFATVAQRLSAASG